MRAIVWSTAAWEIPVREALGLPDLPDSAVRPGWLTDRAAKTLASHLDTFASLPPAWGYFVGPEGEPVCRTGLEGIRHLRRLHRAARAFLGIAEKVHRLPGTCPRDRCGGADLRLVPGAPEAVSCGVCGHIEAAEVYQRRIRLLIHP